MVVFLRKGEIVFSRAGEMNGCSLPLARYQRRGWAVWIEFAGVRLVVGFLSLMFLPTLSFVRVPWFCYRHLAMADELDEVSGLLFGVNKSTP